MFSTTLHLILLFVVQATLAQRYDPLFRGDSQCDYLKYPYYNDTKCGQGLFADFRDPDSVYRDEFMKKWAMIGWIDSAIESFASSNAVAATCLNDSLVNGFLRICQNSEDGSIWGFAGCAYIPCYPGNASVRLAGCLTGATGPGGSPAFNVIALNDTVSNPLQCNSTP